MRKTVMMLSCGMALATAAPAAAQVNVDQLKWGPAPPGLPAGAELAVLAGDPAKAAPYVLRAKFPAGYTIPPHWHPTDENVTVISGDLMLGMGDKVEPSGAKLTAGGFVNAKARMHHYAVSTGGAVVQIHGQGPFQINYVNPADDPRKAAAKP